MKLSRCRLPELCLLAAALFFAFRELATFPASWEDSGLYTMVAQSVAQGQGYALPVLGRPWPYPFFLSVGPAVILPVALAIRLFGFSVGIVRIVPVSYLLGVALLFYVYTKRIANQSVARWSTALLISFSAFVNTGKPVQGSVAAFFFLLLALLFLHRATPKKYTLMAAGVFLGLCVLTKLTFILTLPALAIALGYESFRRRSFPPGGLLALLIAAATASAWIAVCMLQHEGFFTFLGTALARGSGGSIMTALLNKLPLLLRFQYQYFLILLFLAFLGFRKATLHMNTLERTFILSLFLLFFAHFLLREGWYRHLLLAHLLLLPFVPLGAFHLLGRKAGMVLLSFFVLAQGLWQLDHRGSSTSLAALDAVAFIETHLNDTDVLIQHPEIFLRLPSNPHWLYYPLAGTEELMPEGITALSPEQRCLPFIRRLNALEKELYDQRMTVIGGSYFLVSRPEGCP